VNNNDLDIKHMGREEVGRIRLAKHTIQWRAFVKSFFLFFILLFG
jgi:hypothetical protein